MRNTPRRVIDNGDGTASVELTRGYVSIIDATDLELVSRYKWHVCKGDHVTCYAYSTPTVSRGKTVSIPLHRLLMNPPPGQYIDHIDGDGLNNRRSNLRFCGHRQNQWNKVKKHNSSSRFKGVSWDKPKKKWRASIHTPTRPRLHLGHYHDEIEAAKAYDRAAVEHFGAFARVNFPEALAV